MNVIGTMRAITFAAMVGCVAAQIPDAPKPGPVRTLVAKGSLPNTAGTPLFFKLQRVELEPGGSVLTAAAESLLFVLPGGPLTVTSAGQRRSVVPGAGLFLDSRSGATLAPAEGLKVAFLEILLGSAGDLDRPGTGSSAKVTELYRTVSALPGLGAGTLSFDVTQVTFPPHMPANPPHHRSGDALYFVLSGTGAFTTDGKTLSRPPGTPHFEPAGMVHQWANPEETPLVLLVTNVTREGTPAIVFEPLFE